LLYSWNFWICSALMNVFGIVWFSLIILFKGFQCSLSHYPFFWSAMAIKTWLCRWNNSNNGQDQKHSNIETATDLIIGKLDTNQEKYIILNIDKLQYHRAWKFNFSELILLRFLFHQNWPSPEPVGIKLNNFNSRFIHFLSNCVWKLEEEAEKMPIFQNWTPQHWP
jgi:hypothetical protein